MRSVMLVLAVAACSSKTEAPGPVKGSAAAPVAAPLPAGPVPVALPAVDAAQLRTLAHADGFLTIDAQGALRWGLAMTGATPFEGQVLQRDDSTFGQLFPYAEDRGREHHEIRADSVVEPDLDAYAELTHDATTEVVILADAAAPARITLRRALLGFGYHGSTLAAGAANTATLYRFGGKPWSESPQPELTLHVDRLGALSGQHPHSVLLEFTDAATTGQLVAALGALGAAGVQDVRVHRMMGWGDIGPTEVASLEGAAADDDRITPDGPASLDIADPTVTGSIDAPGVTSALAAAKTRFRYCYEKRGKPKLHGDVQLAFDVAADGAISHAKATGVDPKIDSCIAASIFDLDITPLSIHGAGHAKATITFSVSEPAASDAPAQPEPPPSGYWCWTDADVGLCAPREDQCQAALDGYTSTGARLGEPTHATPCTAQRTAWTSDGAHWSPTKKMCGKGCRQVH